MSLIVPVPEDFISTGTEQVPVLVLLQDVKKLAPVLIFCAIFDIMNLNLSNVE